MMSRQRVAIIGGGPYGPPRARLASHLADRNVKHRIFGQPMAFWTQIARAGARRYLKSYCFGTNISSPRPGSTFADYNGPRGLETFEPCSIANFADYGLWFQQQQVDWIEPVDVANVSRFKQGYVLTLSNGDEVEASDVIVATGLCELRKNAARLAGAAWRRRHAHRQELIASPPSRVLKSRSSATASRPSKQPRCSTKPARRRDC